MWTAFPNFSITTLVKFLSSFIKRTVKISACNIGMYQRHVTDIRSRIFNSIVEVIIVQVHKWASADKTIQYWLESPLSKISTRIKGYSSCSMISWPFKRDKGLPSGTVLLQSSLTRKNIPDRRNPLEYYMKPFKQSIQGKKKP